MSSIATGFILYSYDIINVLLVKETFVIIVESGSTRMRNLIDKDDFALVLSRRDVTHGNLMYILQLSIAIHFI